MSKGLEALKFIQFADSESKEIIKKELKALEIIKIHGVDVYCLKHTNNLIEYNTRNAYVDSITLLSPEEYDLLKEVLL